MLFRRIRTARARRESGEVLILGVVVALVLVVIVGIVLDSGVVYGKRAKLSKAVDAAALAGISHVSSVGEHQARRVAVDVFRSNYPFDPHHPGTDYQAPDIDVTFTVDPATSNRTITVDGHAHAAPLFGGLLGIRRFDLGATAQAARAKLVISLVLDRSYSMRTNGGCTALPPAVHAFVDYFDDASDRMSLSTYGTVATLDVPMSRPFRALVHAAVPDDCNTEYAGYTFMDGGFELARQQNLDVPLLPGEDVVKVIVLFTDGMANVFRETFDCPPSTIVHLSSAPAGNNVFVLDPSTGNQVCQSLQGSSFSCCPGLVTFPSVMGGLRAATGPAAAQNVFLESRDRVRVHAARARREGSVVYTIGLGDTLDAAFLREIANDPSSPTFDPDQPVSEFAQAPTAADLEQVFVRLARKIAVRLSY